MKEKRAHEHLNINSAHGILDILYLDTELTINLISLYHSFTLEELEKYWDVLQKGNAHYSVFIKDTDCIYIPQLGLCFNNNLEWTEELRAKWKVGFDNPYMGYMEGLGKAPVEYDDIDDLPTILPLNIVTEIEILNSCLLDHWVSVIAPYQDFDKDNFEEPLQYEVEDFQKEITQLNFEEFKLIYETDKLLITWNQSIWNNTLKEIFTTELINDILLKAASPLPGKL